MSMRTSTLPRPTGFSSTSKRVDWPSSFLMIWAARVATVSGEPRTPWAPCAKGDRDWAAVRASDCTVPSGASAATSASPDLASAISGPASAVRPATAAGFASVVAAVAVVPCPTGVSSLDRGSVAARLRSARWLRLAGAGAGSGRATRPAAVRVVGKVSGEAATVGAGTVTDGLVSAVAATGFAPTISDVSENTGDDDAGAADRAAWTAADDGTGASAWRERVSGRVP